MNLIENTTDFVKLIKDGRTITKYTLFEPTLLRFTVPTILQKLRNNFKNDIEPEYYRELLARYKHIKYKFREGWIKSDRQLIILSDDCISTIHILPGDRINAFIRSSNIDNILEQDVAFLASLTNKELNVFISMPHSWGNNKTKLQNNG